MPRMRYELFIRKAFGMQSGAMPGRGGDPGGLGDADYFGDQGTSLNDTRVGIAYAGHVYSRLFETKSPNDYANEYAYIDDWYNRVIAETQTANFIGLIEEFDQKIVDKYL